jgi:hypothetical protein
MLSFQFLESMRAVIAMCAWAAGETLTICLWWLIKDLLVAAR